MDKTRMQKLAGINEEYTAFNYYFEIDRYNLPEDSIKRSYLNTPIRNGNWCKYEDVAELESVARELLAALKVTEKTLVEVEHEVGGGDDEIDVESAILTARAAIAKIPK